MGTNRNPHQPPKTSVKVNRVKRAKVIAWSVRSALYLPVFAVPLIFDKPVVPIPLWQITVFCVTVVTVVESIGYATKHVYFGNES